MDISQLLLTVLFLGAQSSQVPSDNSTIKPEILRSAQWVLVNNPRINLQFTEGGRMGGSGGCNRFMGSYRLVGNRITFGPIASTQMACEGGNIMAEEFRFLQSLESVQEIGWDGRLLSLSTPTGTLQFRQQTDDPAKPRIPPKGQGRD